ncbi:beta-glucosidase 13-like [Mercurialis annua]|uniref:beta-glucosidase 13-like n=1 Tax=Mercurialis annua TaxID=3986 RepID=UPI0021605133|nr:beta-glucosidase 13-like [Mercurialis annua]
MGNKHQNLKEKSIMATKSSFLLGMVVLLIFSWLDSTKSQNTPEHLHVFDSSYFPDGFLWGSASSAYQAEGAAEKRGVNTWDTFTHDYPERIDDGSNGDIATEFYYLYKNDTKRMNKQLGMNAFRFSIAWSRVIPSGNISAGISEEGIDFYNSVINETIKNGMIPFVTIFHWDVPQELEDNYGGFRSYNIVSDYKDFAELCFQRFGDRVKHWITFNEPHIFTSQGYDLGILAPGRCSEWVNRACAEGDSGTEPYIVAHNLLLAHAAAVALYKEQGFDGEIGITLDITWAYPYSNSTDDIRSVYRYVDFIFGWFMNPVTYGHYPRIMRELVGDRLPVFNKTESKSLKGSYDFVGINYYTSNYASANLIPDPDPTHIRYTTDMKVNLTMYNTNGQYIGVQGSPSWLYVVPQGLESVMKYVKDVYKNPIIYITENGVGDAIDLSPTDALKDIWRISYHNQHLWKLLRAICDHGVRVKGYFAWAFIDNFEWANGYTVRMGLYAMDTSKNLMRTPKLSVNWFKEFLKDKDSTGGPKCSIPEVVQSSVEDDEEL